MPGPGTHLHHILAELGIHPGPDCPCHAHAAQMNAWGPAVCRQELDTIRGWLEDAKISFGWKRRMIATARALTTGLAFKIDLGDPVGWLIDEAILRSESSLAANRS